jgi:hypothetical protein
MLEDKIKATDWEATNEAIEEQVARESYLQWLRDNEMRKAVSINPIIIISYSFYWSKKTQSRLLNQAISK